MVEIRNKEEFERWLEGRNREEVTLLAARVALRVAPLLGRAEQGSGFRARILLPNLRPLNLALFSTDEAGGFSPASYIDAIIYTGITSAVAYAAAAAATRAAVSAISSISAAVTAADAYADDIWRSLSQDATVLAAGASADELRAAPLWRSGEPDWAREAWADLKSYLAQFPEEHWEVWTDWYEDRLAGRPINTALERDRIAIPSEEKLWEQGPAAVNARLKQIIAEHEAQALVQNPSGQPFAEHSGKIDVDDLADKGHVADDAETREDHAAARESLEDLKTMCAASNRLSDLGGRTEKALGALGDSIPQIQANALARALQRLKLALEADERRRDEKDPDQPPLETGEWEALRIAVADLNALTASDNHLAVYRAKYEERAPNPPPVAEVVAMAESAQTAEAATPRAVEAVKEAAETRSEAGGQTIANFLRRAVKIARQAAAVGLGVAVVGGWLVANEATVIPIAEKIAPDLAPILQKTIDFVKGMPIRKP